MVNYGVSRGCRTCKKRHKKCDEARPCCNRCIKANLTCSGYEAEGDLIFRRYRAEAEPTEITPLTEGSDASASDDRHVGFLTQSLQQHAINDEELEETALALFLSDYCLTTENPLLSRGYLEGLEPLLTRLSPSSNVAKATKTAALASLGKKLGEPALLEKANIAYSDLLRSFQFTMSREQTANTVESLTTAILLGLYEIITASKTYPGKHVAHMKGVTAILSSGESVFSRHPASQIIRGKSCSGEVLKGESLMWPIDLGIIIPTAPGPSIPSLDVLLSCYGPVFRQGAMLTFDPKAPLAELRSFRDYAISVDQEFAQWPSQQPKSWMPRTIGVVPKGAMMNLVPGLASFSGRADVYFDIYVSHVWNSYRKCRLLALDYINTCSQRLVAANVPEALPPSAYLQPNLLTEARELAESIAATVPFHLLGDVEKLFRQLDAICSHGWETVQQGKAVGGLLLMHPILAVASMEIVPLHLREMFRECLTWIGKIMGIGQAGVLADPEEKFPKRFLADGHVLVCAGTLIP